LNLFDLLFIECFILFLYFELPSVCPGLSLFLIICWIRINSSKIFIIITVKKYGCPGSIEASSEEHGPRQNDEQNSSQTQYCYICSVHQTSSIIDHSHFITQKIDENLTIGLLPHRTNTLCSQSLRSPELLLRSSLQNYWNHAVSPRCFE